MKKIKRVLVALVVIASVSMLATGLTGCRKKARASQPPSQAQVQAAQQAVATAPAPEIAPPRLKQPATAPRSLTAPALNPPVTTRAMPQPVLPTHPLSSEDAGVVK